MDHDLGRTLMAICNLEGIWDGSMQIPMPSRVLLVEQAEGRWKLDPRGYPIPTEQLIEECEKLRAQEDQWKTRSAQTGSF
jgi:hypothetical protein